MKKRKKKEKKYLKLILKVLLFIGIALLVMVGKLYFTTDGTLQDVIGLDPNASTKPEPESESIEENEEIAIPGFSRLVMRQNSTTQNVFLENPAENDVYFIISLAIEDEVVYESGLIEPGKGIYSIELPRVYATGEYAGKIKYETRSMSNPDEEKNGAEINVPIVVE